MDDRTAIAIAAYRRTLRAYDAGTADDLDVAQSAETLFALGLEWSDIDAMTDEVA